MNYKVVDHPGLSLIKQLIYRRKGIGAPLTDIGHYTGIIELGDYAIGITTDGVGSKIMISNEMKKWDTIGIDCVGMNVNDIIAMGLIPISFLDYVAIEKKCDSIMEQIGIGLNKGAEIANISIVGGETAVLPEIVNGFDLVGMCLGIAKKERIITGEKIDIGDAIIGLPSTGIHSNGYTTVRRILRNARYDFDDYLPYNNHVTIGDELLIPTKIYIEVLDVINNFDIHGLAHITGGGITKLHRITQYGFNISYPLEPQPIFKFLQDEGKMKDIDMYKIFNMGMGFVVILPKKEANNVANILNGKIVGNIIDRGIYIKGIEIK